MSDYSDYDSESRYSSSDNEDDYYCYYCETDLDYENNVFEDLQPCKPRYYCESCKLHIHTSDIETSDIEDD
jgi:hypothetical protein